MSGIVVDGPAGAVQRVLHMPEILENIMQYVNRAALSRTARVCSVLHHTSIRCLWSGKEPWFHQDELCSDPDDQYSTSDDEDEPYSSPDLLEALTSMLPSDPSLWSESEDAWARFKHYSTHIHTLGIGSWNYDAELFQLIDGGSKPDLFPRLQRLAITWQVATDEWEFHWMALGGAGLRAFEICGRPDADEAICLSALDVISHLLAIKFSNLSRFSVTRSTNEPQSGYFSGQYATLSPRLLSNLQHFTWLVPVPLSPHILNALPTLPHLSRLAVSHTVRFEDIYQENNTFFPSLRRLELVEVQDIDPWFGKLTSPGLVTHLRLECVHLSLPSLQSHNIVEIEVTCGRLKAWEDFHPLLSCRHVRRCELRTWGIKEGFNDSTLGAIASAWSEIEHLALAVGSRERPSLTLLGIAHFATSCPRLEFLEVDASASLRFHYGEAWKDEYHRVMSASYPSRVLTGLWLKEAPPSKTVEFDDWGLGALGVARLLRKLWPSLQPASIETKNSQVLRALMTGMDYGRDREHEESRRIIQEQESKLEELQKERDQLRKDCARLRNESKTRD